MKMMSGFLGSYLEGFDPSRRPAWLATRVVAEVVGVVDFAVTVVVTTAVMRLAMLTAESKKSLFLHGPTIHKRDGDEGGGRWGGGAMSLYTLSVGWLSCYLR